MRLRPSLRRLARPGISLAVSASEMSMRFSTSRATDRRARRRSTASPLSVFDPPAFSPSFAPMTLTARVWLPRPSDPRFMLTCLALGCMPPRMLSVLQRPTRSASTSSTSSLSARCLDAERTMNVRCFSGACTVVRARWAASPSVSSAVTSTATSVSQMVPKAPTGPAPPVPPIPAVLAAASSPAGSVSSTTVMESRLELEPASLMAEKSPSNLACLLL
mmetsp:Transcript_27418/g.68657  ORF Transcript_27418/g.68657 Transcript_27418/m.68657 type:complete len:219 (+) Transcript_27418:2762-3418(+)